ncbi:MAG: response regulator [Aquabacterium sp.]|nr:response regulator [Aquabacterium sp.]
MRFQPTEDGLKMALSAAQAGLWEWHLGTNLNTWSQEVWPLFGLPPDTPPSHDAWLAGIHPEDRERSVQLVSAAREKGEPFELEWRTNPDNGPIRWIMSRGQPGQALPDGQATYTGIVMDITARKEAERAILRLSESLEERVKERTAALGEHERLLQHILDGIPGLIGYWTKDLRNRFANKAYLDWFGMPGEQLRNRHIKDLLGPELFQQNWPYMKAALEGQRQRFERIIPIPTQPGQARHSEAHYIPDIVDGVVQGFLVIVFDISQIKQAELAAEAANQAKSEFLANISHEVRTPLNAMFGLAQIGARQAAGTPQARTFEQMLDSANHLLTLVNDVLDFSRIESGKLNLQYERINLGQVLEHVLTLKAILAQAKGLPLIIHESPDVPQYFHGDATRLSQILLNLLSNAIKFTDSGQVAIRLDYIAPDLIMEVSDTGIGMSADKLEQLFQPFVQVHGHHPAQSGGTGLGLAICKRLVEMMRGHIQVISQPGQGTTFTVKLPALHPEAGDTRHIRHVAMIGQSTPASAALCDSLRDRGLKVTNGTALPLPPSCQPDVIVLSSDALPRCEPAEIRRNIEWGHTVLVNAPASAVVELPSTLRNELPVVAGPLSPLRLLNAIKTKFNRTTVNSTQRLANIRVLAAEDNPVNRLVLQQMLEQEGALVTCAFDGAHALEQVRVQGPSSFDVVLCDIQMPVMDGYQAAQALGHIAPSLPVIGLTAHAFDTAKQQARRAGMVGYVTKPYMLDTLVDEIRRFARWRPGNTPPMAPPAAAPATMNNEPDMQHDINDWQAMQQYFQAQPQLLDRLIAMLGDTLHEIQQDLERAIKGQNLEQLAKIAHNIKGTALNLHTPELARLAVQTQEQARTGDHDTLLTAETLSSRLSHFIEMAAHHLTQKRQSTPN